MRRTVPLAIAVVAPLCAAAVAVVIGLILTGTIGPGESSAEAGGQNRAVVVVDTGSSVRAACVLFSEDSISGAEALQRAGMDPVLQGYSGLGSGVCALNGVGCPSDGNCFTCQAPNYWQYWRSSGGGFTYSNSGASGTQVRDGSVEGWSWGSQASPPPFQSVDAVCGAEEPPPTSPPATPPPASGGTGTGDGGGSSGGAVVPGGGPTPTTPDGQPATTTTSAPGETTTTTAVDEGDPEDGASTSESSDDEDDGEQATSSITDAEDGGSPAGSIALATGALAAVGFFVWRARHKNHLAGTDGVSSFDGDEGPTSLERLDDPDDTTPGAG